MLKIDYRNDLNIKLQVDEMKGIMPTVPGVDIKEVVRSIENMDLKYLNMDEFDKYAFFLKEMETCAGIYDFMSLDVNPLTTANAGIAKGYMEVLKANRKEMCEAIAKHVVGCIYVMNDDGEITEFKKKGIESIQQALKNEVNSTDLDLSEDFFNAQMLYLIEHGWERFDPAKAKFSTFVTKFLYRPHSIVLYNEITEYSKLTRGVAGREEPDSVGLEEVFYQFKDELVEKGILKKKNCDILMASYEYNELMDNKDKMTLIGKYSKCDYIRKELGLGCLTDKKINGIIYHSKQKLQKAIEDGEFKSIQERLRR